MTAHGIAVCWVLLGLIAAATERALVKEPMPLWLWLLFVGLGPVSTAIMAAAIVINADFWHKEL